MKNFQLLASCPEVIGAVVSDAHGALLQSAGDIDAESVGAIISYSAAALANTGAGLGLGDLSRIVVSGSARTCVISMRQQEFLGVYIDSNRPLAAFEKKMDDLLQR
ncbi:MAG TPA: roadblock/LC7 domain-containing protein [Polyangiaceae bacterium]|jgi:predicted regulator of Ras-like GTPase activity (Roadblock/LC7/MglB family)|nr:roadblock/LC7 domain-containing protein [Polyangiaceae bacterium]